MCSTHPASRHSHPTAEGTCQARSGKETGFLSAFRPCSLLLQLTFLTGMVHPWHSDPLMAPFHQPCSLYSILLQGTASPCSLLPPPHFSHFAYLAPDSSLSICYRITNSRKPTPPTPSLLPPHTAHHDLLGGNDSFLIQTP